MASYHSYKLAWEVCKITSSELSVVLVASAFNLKLLNAFYICYLDAAFTANISDFSGLDVTLPKNLANSRALSAIC
jgi:hypothetical protein